MRSPLESPQQRLPVWLMGCGDLYQLVHVCEVDTVTDNSYCIDCVLTHSVVDCGPPSIIGNGSPGTPTSTTFGGMVTYTCDTGYEISNGATTATATCMANRMWEPVLTCSRKSYNCSCHQFHACIFTAVDCGSLDVPSNGAVNTFSGTTFMMTATYTCNTGYNIVGSESRTCGASGTSGVWSGEPPVCNCKIN